MHDLIIKRDWKCTFAILDMCFFQFFAFINMLSYWYVLFARVSGSFVAWMTSWFINSVWRFHHSSGRLGEFSETLCNTHKILEAWLDFSVVDDEYVQVTPPKNLWFRFVTWKSYVTPSWSVRMDSQWTLSSELAGMILRARWPSVHQWLAALKLESWDSCHLIYVIICALLSTNISLSQDAFEEDFPFPQLGYASSFLGGSWVGSKKAWNFHR